MHTIIIMLLTSQSTVIGLVVSSSFTWFLPFMLLLLTYWLWQLSPTTQRKQCLQNIVAPWSPWIWILPKFFCTAKLYTKETNDYDVITSHITVCTALVMCLCLACYHVITQSRCGNKFWQKYKVNSQEVPCTNHPY